MSLDINNSSQAWASQPADEPEEWALDNDFAESDDGVGSVVSLTDSIHVGIQEEMIHVLRAALKAREDQLEAEARYREHMSKTFQDMKKIQADEQERGQNALQKLILEKQELQQKLDEVKQAAEHDARDLKEVTQSMRSQTEVARLHRIAFLKHQTQLSNRLEEQIKLRYRVEESLQERQGQVEGLRKAMEEAKKTHTREIHAVREAEAEKSATELSQMKDSQREKVVALHARIEDLLDKHRKVKEDLDKHHEPGQEEQRTGIKSLEETEEREEDSDTMTERLLRLTHQASTANSAMLTYQAELETAEKDLVKLRQKHTAERLQLHSMIEKLQDHLAKYYKYMDTVLNKHAEDRKIMGQKAREAREALLQQEQKADQLQREIHDVKRENSMIEEQALDLKQKLLAAQQKIDNEKALAVAVNKESLAREVAAQSLIKDLKDRVVMLTMQNSADSASSAESSTFASEAQLTMFEELLEK